MSETIGATEEANSNTDIESDEISRKPKDYRPEGNHFFQTFSERGGKVEDSGVEPWVITYLIKNGKLHHSEDDGRFVFKGYIEDNTGKERRWWLPVQKMENQPNLITTCPYVKGLKNIDIKLLKPIKPEALN